MADTLEKVLNEKGEEVVNLVGAAKLANVDPTAIRYWILTGKLPAEKRGGRWQMRVVDVETANRNAIQSTRAGIRGKRGKFIRIEDGE